MYKTVYRKNVKKDIDKLSINGLDKKAQSLIEIIKNNPCQTPPPFEKLLGDLHGACSRRINIQHRLIYQIIEEEKTIKILSMWTHYENI